METLLAEYIIVGQGAFMVYLFRDVLRFALCRFHVTNTNSFSTVSNSVGFKMLIVPFKVFIFHGRKLNDSDEVLTFGLFVVLPASCFDRYAN